MESTHHILIVDDSPSIRALLADFLKSEGRLCRTASDAEEALSILAAGGVDVVVTDIKMPGMDGIALTKAISAVYPEISVMIMTGFGAEYSESDAVEAGAGDFITKPFNLGEFSARLTKMIRQKEVLAKMHELKFAAHYDSLTGLPNRLLFFDRMSQSLEYAKRYRHNLGLMYLDLDDFKPINDTYGHDTGDQVLKEAAGRLMTCIRKSDTAARLGGDEFVLLVSPITDQEEAEMVARRIISLLSKPFFVDARECRIGVSIGISIFPSDGDDADILLREADKAMYAAKKMGKNNFRFYRDSG